MNIERLEEALLDYDGGTCRDINFDNPSWAGIRELISSFQALFEHRLAFDAAGELINEPHFNEAVLAAQNGGYALLEYSSGNRLLKKLQIFISDEGDPSPFIELTFFPEDILATHNLGIQFVEWLEEMQKSLQAKRYYCRYENASWKFGDIGPRSGVFSTTN